MVEEDIRFSKDSIDAHIIIRSVSKELYNYYRSVTLVQLQGNDIFSFSDPQPILSNIDGGIGILGGYTEKEHMITMPQSKFYIPNRIDIAIENSGCTSPCTVKFTVSSDAGEDFPYTWTFGDGSSATGRVVEHQYTSPGQYQVEMNIDLGGGQGYGWNDQVTIN